MSRVEERSVAMENGEQDSGVEIFANHNDDIVQVLSRGTR